MLMNALKEVIQTTFIKTKLHLKLLIINIFKLASKMAVTGLKYSLRQSLKFQKKLR